jgi:hypothetical protein
MPAPGTQAVADNPLAVGILVDQGSLEEGNLFVYHMLEDILVEDILEGGILGEGILVEDSLFVADRLVGTYLRAMNKNLTEELFAVVLVHCLFAQ